MGSEHDALSRAGIQADAPLADDSGPGADPSAEPDVRTPAPSGGRAALEHFAPRPAEAFHALSTAAWQAMAEAERVDLFDLAAKAVAGLQGLAPLERPTHLGPSPWAAGDPTAWRQIEGLGDSDRAALRFAEQMSFDVASLGEPERQGLFEALGPDAPAFAQAVYAADLLPRARGALDALFGQSESWSRPEAGGGTAGADLPGAIDEIIRRIPALQWLDPVTTELVRLLGARRHRCRICQSLRSRSAMVAGAGDAMFDAVDDFAASDLGPAHKAALAFTEAMIGTPGRIGEGVARGLRAHFEPAACVELVLDLTRNASNKVAVALAADAPRVETGYEVYDVTPEGELLYGLEAP